MANEGKGSIFYGLHFYPGLAQYQEEGSDEYRVFLNEDTLRSMDPSFAGRPVFVLHVDEVESDLNTLRKEADGWVIESFYNPSDGKHWAKFVVVSDEGLSAVNRGMKLSNCYIPKTFGPGGVWNGIDYEKEITSAEYEHLAIVPNPRYEESVILDPEEFKAYNEEKLSELKKIANNKDEGKKKMKFNFFKRTKVENSMDLESMLVVLPKSKREVSIEKLINEADEHEMEDKKKDADEHEKMAHPDHMVDCNGEKMTVNDMMEKYKDAMYALSKRKEDAEEHEKSMDPAEMNDDDEMMDADDAAPEEDKAKKTALKLAEDDEKEIEMEKRKNAQIKAERLRNAHKNAPAEVKKISLSMDKVARGRQLYGSN